MDDDVFTHTDSFGDKLSIWFTHGRGLIVTTGNGPADGDIIELSPDATNRLLDWMASQ